RLRPRPQRREERHRQTGNPGVPASSAGSPSRSRPPAPIRSGLPAVAFFAAANRRTGRVHRPRGRCDGIHNRRGRRKVHDPLQRSRPGLKHRGRMRIYENLFIVRPDATEEEIDHLIDGMSKTVTSGGGTLDKVEKWGKRKLAYRVDKHREGSYVLMQFTAGPELVKEFERRLRVQDAVIKFLSVRIDEVLKRIEKRRKEREKRAH